MKSVIAFIILAGAAVYFIARERSENARLREQVELLTDQLSAAGIGPDGRPSTTAGRKQIPCPACHGQGKIMAPPRMGPGAPGGSGATPQMCPVCGGKGKREFDVPPGNEICSDCKGMGKRLAPPQQPGAGLQMSSLNSSAVATNCERCFGKGYLKTGGK